MEKYFLGTTTLSPKVDIINQKIEIDVVEKMNGMIVNHNKEIIDLKENMIRAALIALGWTPPGESNNGINRTPPVDGGKLNCCYFTKLK